MTEGGQGMGLKAEGEYPALTGIEEDGAALRLLSPVYAGREGELTATLQYVYQSVLLGASGEEKLSKLLLSIAVTEMHHVQILGTLITKLGAPPLFTARPPYPVGYYSASCVNYVRSVQGMLSADILLEREAIACYERILSKLDHPRVAAVLARILRDEEVHLSTLEGAQREYLR